MQEWERRETGKGSNGKGKGNEKGDTGTALATVSSEKHGAKTDDGGRNGSHAGYILIWHDPETLQFHYVPPYSY